VGSTYVVPGTARAALFITSAPWVRRLTAYSAEQQQLVYSLDWSDPLGASGNDYDLFVVNTAGTTVKAASTNVQNGSIDPHEEIGSTAFTRATGDRLVIFKTTGAAVRALISTRTEGA